jgi:hypothetical protein
MKFNSKVHMAQELIAGKRFADDIDVVVYYDEKLPNPFRYGSSEMNGIWDDYNKDIWTEVKPRHVHQDLIDSYQEGQVWQYRHSSNANWRDLSNHLTDWQPDWKEDTQYRLHPHNELIQAHRNGAKIQAYICGDWIEEPYPDWYEDTQYRVKPVTKTVYEWMFKTKYKNNWIVESILLSEEEAKHYFNKHEYQKTGRSWEVEA